MPVTIAVYDGVTLSSAAVGGLDQETNFITVRIDPGFKPIYLTLISYEPMVWRIVGATGRVTQVVATSFLTDHKGAPATGIVGVPEGRLFFASPACSNLLNDPGAAASVWDGTNVKPSLSPSRIVLNSAQMISIPSGLATLRPSQGEPAPAGFDPPAWRDALTYWPGGIVLVPPRRVLSPATVQSYRVLPSQAGIAELIGEDSIITTAMERYRIVRPIPRFPPSMGGAHSVALYLARGVPIPDGDLAHSCLIIEETGERRNCNW